MLPDFDSWLTGLECRHPETPAEEVGIRVVIQWGNESTQAIKVRPCFTVTPIFCISHVRALDARHFHLVKNNGASLSVNCGQR